MSVVTNLSTMFSRINPIQVMADGTVKQINPFSGTEVWTVVGRGNRPIAQPPADTAPLMPSDRTEFCAFCADRTYETPPEKARMLPSGEILTHVPLSHQADTSPLFRRVANLFEIVTYKYWQANYGFQMDETTSSWRNAYLSTPQGREHVVSAISTKVKAAGQDPAAFTQEQLLEEAECFFGGGHDLIIAAEHFSPGATNRSQLASSGCLTPDQHFLLTKLTAQSTWDLYQRNRYARYVAVFQNWLKPAGASFDHLHKQLVAIDERSAHAAQEIDKLRTNLNMYNELAVDYAAQQNLIIAENDYAVCFAGFGHRYPTLEVFSKSATSEPWLQTEEELRGMSDLIHACHAAAGPEVPCNEEWHHKPIDLDVPMPWRIMIKWRVSTLAGFEGGTKVYLNTISPWDMRDRVVSAMYRLRDEGAIAQNIKIATECSVARNSLKYNPFVR